MRNRILITLGVLFLVGLGLRFAGIGMSRADLHVSAAAEPLACLGGVMEGEHCSPGTIIPITNSVIMTLLIDLLLVLTIVFGTMAMKLVPTGFQNTIEAVVEAFYNFSVSIDRKNVGKFFAIPMTILLFFVYANFAALVPGVGSIGSCVVASHEEEAPAEVEGTPETNAAPAEPSRFAGLPGYCGEGHALIPWFRAPAADLNVTLAFALVTMFMVQFFGFQALGLNYLTKFFNFREGPLGVYVGLIELISEISRIISFAFRIFGNIFGGEVILVVMSYLFPYLLPLPFYGFEVFVAFLQGLIFAILALIFFSLATTAHGGHDEHGHDETVQIEADIGRATAH